MNNLQLLPPTTTTPSSSDNKAAVTGSNNDKYCLVLNIQSKLGRMLVQSLAEHGVKVQTIVASTQQSALTQQWESAPLNVKVIKGNIEDKQTIVEALQSSYAVVYCSWPLQCLQVKQEETLSKMIIDCAHDLMGGPNLKQFIYISTDGVDTKLDVQCLQMRKQVEDYLQNSGVFKSILKEHTCVIRPVSLMDDLYNVIVDQQFFLLPMGEQDTVQLVSAEDVAWLVQQALSNPQQYSGKVITWAGAQMTMKQVHEIYEKVTGEKLTLLHTKNVTSAARGMFPRENAPTFDEFRWLHMVGYSGNVNSCLQMHPNMQTLEQVFAKKNKEKMEASLQKTKEFPIALGSPRAYHVDVPTTSSGKLS